MIQTKERLIINRELEKIYFSIQEVAKKYGVAQSKIRYWCDYFSLQVKRNTKKERQFTRANIIELDKIHWLVEKEEFTLPGALKKLPTIKHSPYERTAEEAIS